ncbi:hypothetical protein [Treponema sp.]|uniref:hypothetical protein n=1 Tax=Treponema sp. TaxID=166 RepID=UPI00298ECFDF|nr:hypothetical protein [Treponema sp.]MCQ2240976.1 hypothetical protein [Treponema sp.]
MTSLPKVALSMLISVVVFAGCLFFSFAGGFRLIEVQYYTPRVIGNINDRLEKIKFSYGDYFSTMDEQFRKFLSDRSVASYIEREPSKENMDERDRLCGLLFQKNSGLDGIRLIENDGIHIHFSTFQEDVLSESLDLITYANYTDRIPFTLIETGDGEKNTKVYFDNAKNRLLFSYPFYDVYTACRGTMIFYVAGDDFTRYLIGKDVVSLNARGTVLSPAGFVFNIPLTGRNMLIQEIQSRWEKRHSNIEQLVESDVKKENLFVVSTTNENGIKIGWICSQDEFEFTETEKISLLVCLFITVFLIIFLLFNLRHDDMVLIRRRIRKFQYGLLKEYIERKDSSDWKSLSKEIASRRMDVNDEIKRSLGRRGKKHSAEIDAMLEESWQDIMSAVGATSGRILVERKTDAPAENVVAEVIPSAPVEKINEPEPVEELEEVEEAEPVEELEEVDEAEPVEELEEIEEAEPVEEVEEIIEQSFSDYAREENFPEERIKPANADEIRQKSKDNFSVADLNFSNLDDGEN